MVGAIVMTWVINGFTSIQQYTGVVYSVIMILLLIFLPMGLAGLFPARPISVGTVPQAEPSRTIESPPSPRPRLNRWLRDAGALPVDVPGAPRQA